MSRAELMPRPPLWRRPIAHFLALGATLFALAQAVGSAGNVAEELPAIVITADKIAEIRAAATTPGGQPPGGVDLRALVDAAIDEEILLREARLRGLEVHDAVVERRLVQNMRFVTADDAAGEAVLLRRARAAGLFDGDAVIRRRLAQKMKFVLQGEASTEPPSERQLRDYFGAHVAELSAPPRVRMTQLFFSGPQALQKAAAELQELQRLAVPPERACGRGDAFLTGCELPHSSEPSLAKIFGAELARDSMTLPLNVWSGPVRSTYGAHVIWIHERTPRSAPAFTAVRDAVRQRLEAEGAARALRDGLRRLRRRYVVRVDWPSAGGHEP
jgi:hypothetical protein